MDIKQAPGVALNLRAAGTESLLGWENGRTQAAHLSVGPHVGWRGSSSLRVCEVACDTHTVADDGECGRMLLVTGWISRVEV